MVAFYSLMKRISIKLNAAKCVCNITTTVGAELFPLYIYIEKCYFNSPPSMMCLLNSFFLAYLPQHKFMYVYIYGYTYNLCLLILIVCGGDVVSLCATLFMFDGVTTVRELFSPWLACLSCHTYTYMLAEFLCLQLGGEDHHDLA